jgi:hypothetical protein
MQDLFKQQLKLTREEIETDLRKTREAGALLGAGWFICLIGGVAICLMVAHLLHWLGLPMGVTDQSSIPLWGCFGIAGALFLGAGWLTIMAGQKKLDGLGTPLHETARALKENLEWKTKTTSF